ncbi:hypothetical protein VNO78_13415 [Psophocarpus tetragonolobus]|uniref:Pentatricopeptide repeat-containing protein n=1 Tax=Psophocarpus tetragonolobus TaxID=3891 RepID=A0AAN9SQ32_PSOTE
MKRERLASLRRSGELNRKMMVPWKGRRLVQFCTAAAAAAAAGGGGNRDTAILARLKEKDWLTPKEASNLLTSLRHPSSTLSFFHLYTSRYDFLPSESLCITLISKLALSHHLHPILSLHQTLLTHPRPFSDNLFYALIKAYAHSFHRIDIALHTLHHMPSPSTRTFNFLLNVLVNLRLHDAARHLFLHAPRLGVPLDACTLNILIKGLCARGHLNAAFGVLGEFQGLGCQATARTYATLMKGLCEMGRVEEAFGLLEKMESGGVDADVAVFNILIGGLRKLGRVDEGWRVLEGMLGKGVSPNAVTYNEVLSGLVQNGRFHEGKDLVENMGFKGFLPSFGAYKALVLGFSDNERLQELEWVLRDMVRKGFVPRMGMWRKIVKCLVQKEENSLSLAFAIHAVLQLDHD